MKIISLVISLLILLISIAFGYTKFYSVKYVYDGDTICLYNGIKVRYIGIDAPEVDHKNGNHEYLALQSRDMNISLTQNRPINLVFDEEKRDRYGRLLAYAFTENGDMINSLLLKHGLAWIMSTPPNLKYRPVLLKAQRQAIAGKLGIWQRHIADTEYSYTGNKKSYRFHRPDCTFGKLILPQNRVLFKTARDAFWDGFSPCTECMPDKASQPGK